MRFYLKKGGWGWAVYHRPTHAYLYNGESMESAASYIREMNANPTVELWRHLLFVHKVRIPRKDVVNGTQRDAGFAEQEQAFKQSWKYGTEEFYKKYPKLLVEDKIDYALISKLQNDERNRLHELEEARRKNSKKIIRTRDEHGRIAIRIRKLA